MDNREEPVKLPDVAAAKEKRVFRAPAEDSAAGKALRGRRETAGLGPTDDLPEDAPEKRAYRDAADPFAEDAAKKKKYRSSLGDYDEAAGEPADPVFQYKRGRESARPKWGVLIICVAAALLVTAAAALLLPDGNPISALFDNIFNSTPLTRGDDVMTIADSPVSGDMYLHFLLTARDQIDAAHPGYFQSNPDMFAKLRSLAERQLRQLAGYKKLASELGVSADDADRQLAESYLEESRASYASDLEFSNALTNAYLTEDLYRELLLGDIVRDKVYSAAAELPAYSSVSAQQAEEYADENGILRAKRILLLAPSGVSAEVDAAKGALADELLAKLAAGEDFDALAAQYGEDPAGSAGETFKTGERPADYESAVRALSCGQTSGVIRTSEGYSIAVRLEPDAALLSDEIIRSRVDEKAREYADGLSVRYSRGYERISYDNAAWPYAAQTISSAAQQAGGQQADEQQTDEQQTDEQAPAGDGETA